MKTNIVLAQCPTWGIYDPPNALAQISSYLKHKGYTVKVFDINIGLYNIRKEEYKNAWAIEQSSFWCYADNVMNYFLDNQNDIKEYINRMLNFKPAVIGFSVNITSLYSTLEFAKLIKEENPHIKIIVGGPLFLVPADIGGILRNGIIDFIVLGEGEETLAELLDNLERGRGLDQCRGICFKRDDKIIQTEARPLIKNLDELPFLDFTELPLDKYDPPGHLGRHISLMTCRGCIQNCVFCGPRAYWPGYRYMSGKRIYEEIKFHLKSHPEIEHIEFLDLLFNGNMKVLNDFCDLMISNSPKRDLRWHANVVIRPEMAYEVLQKMKKAGCHHLTYGIESGSQHVLDLMRKRYKIEDADRVVENTHKAGITVTCNFMFGFPGEIEEDFEKTLDFLKRNAGYIDTAYPSRTYCTIEPHSYLEKHMDEFGIAPNPINNTYWESKDGKNNYPERLRRSEIFSSLASSVGVTVGLGLQTSIELDKYYNLGHYYESKRDNKKALYYFLKYLELDSKNKTIIDKAERLKNKCLNLSNV